MLPSQSDSPTPRNADIALTVSLVRDGQRLSARVDAREASEGSLFAFYLLKGNERVATRHYSTEASATFEPVAAPGTYRVRAFVRQPGSERATASSSEAVVVPPMPAGSLRRIKTAPLSKVAAPADGPIRTEQLYLANNGTRAGARHGTISYQPRADVKPFLIEWPLDWSVDPYQDRNWNAQLHMWRMGDYILFAAERTRNFDRLLAFVDIVLDWHRHHIVERQHSIYAWKDMMVGIRAMKLAYLISQWQHGRVQLNDRVVGVMHDLVETHLGFLLDPTELRFSNHTLSDLHGAMAIAQVVDPRTRQRIEVFVERFLPKVLGAQFDANGVHLENSLGYHRYGITYLKRLQASQWFDKFGLTEVVQRAESALQWFYLPDGRMAAVGDTDGSPPPTGMVCTAFEGSNQLFNASGYVVMRDDGGGDLRRSSYLLFMGAYNSKFHKQADDLSVVWYHGEEILCDAGKYAYKTDETRGYVISRRAHNTVEVDKPADHELSGAPYGSAVERVETFAWGRLIQGTVHLDASKVTQRRQCLHSLDGWLLLIDHMTSRTVHEYVQWSHFAPAIGGFSVRDLGYDASLSGGGKLLVRSAVNAASSMQLVCGTAPPRRQGWISQGYRVIEPNAALGIRAVADNVVIATLYAVDAGHCALTFARDRSLSVVVETRTGRRCLRLQWSGKTCEVLDES